MFIIITLILLFINVLQLKSSLLKVRDWDNDIESNCRNKCGDKSLPTCSCDTRCRIRRNCCRDFETSCPVEFNHSEDVFFNFIELIKECDSSHYLLISECPKEKSLLTQLDADIVTRLQTISEGHGGVNRLFSNVPVTDLDSGLSFKNVSVYMCNSMPDSNMQFWNVHMDNFSIGHNGVLTYDELSRVESAVFPPANLAKYPNILQCNYEDMIVPETSSSVLNLRPSPGFEDFDKLCKICFHTLKSEVVNTSQEEHRHKFSFPITVSFVKNQFIFQTEASYTGKDTIPWRRMQCSNLKINTGNMSSIGNVCSIVSCVEYFEKRPDGQCRMPHLLQLAVTDDKIPMTKSCLGRLSSFLACYLRKYSGYDVVDKWHVSDRYFDEKQQMTFFGTPLLLYSSTEIDIYNNITVADYHFSNFIKVIQVLRSYRCRLEERDSEKIMPLKPVSTYTFGALQRMKYKGSINKSTALPVCVNVAPNQHSFDPSIKNFMLECLYVPATDAEDNLSKKEINFENNNMCLNFFTVSAQLANKYPDKYMSFLIMVSILLIQ